MRERPGRLRAPLPAALTGEAISEEAREILAQAQAALADEQRPAILRALQRLHRLLVPALDAHLAALAGAAPVTAAAPPMSSGVGLLALLQELPDLDVERESAPALLIECAAQALEDGALAALGEGDGPGAVVLAPLGAGGDAAAQWAWLAARMAALPLPRPRWWRRLRRAAGGALPDDARILLQRGSQIVWERVGGGAGRDPDEAPGAPAETDLGTLRPGDRLTLQVPVALPGRVAVLAAAGDERQAELSLVLPQSALEDVPRRAQEVVEVVGEIEAVPGAAEQGLVVLWVPELLPAGWVLRVLAQQRLPPDARLRRYRYQVAEPARPRS